jgi:hypothetical protein
MKFDINERELKKLVQPKLDKIAKEYSKEFDAFSKKYKGKSPATIKPALRNLLRKKGGKMSDRELNEYAQLISEGTPIKFRT